MIRGGDWRMLHFECQHLMVVGDRLELRGPDGITLAISLSP